MDEEVQEILFSVFWENSLWIAQTNYLKSKPVFKVLLKFCPPKP